MIVTMSLGGPEPTAIIEDAIDYAISKGVIVVAAAGNSGTEGMDWPGAYPQVISVGASGWKYEWYWPKLTPPSGPSGSQRYRLWWLQQNTWFPGGYSSGYNDIPNPTPAKQVYITDFSGRQLKSTPFTNCGPTHDQPCVQDLDVVAPGSWVRGPFPGLPGYAHLPWWSEGIGGLVGLNPGNFYYVGGTSMATPHVASVIALMLEKNPSLTQSAVESILESTALKISAGSMTVFDLVPTPGFYTYSWGKDATGRGLVQANKALAAVP